jgi:hypothetical protein
MLNVVDVIGVACTGAYEDDVSLVEVFREGLQPKGAQARRDAVPLFAGL